MIGADQCSYFVSRFDQAHTGDSRTINQRLHSCCTERRPSNSKNLKTRDLSLKCGDKIPTMQVARGFAGDEKDAGIADCGLRIADCGVKVFKFKVSGPKFGKSCFFSRLHLFLICPLRYFQTGNYNPFRHFQRL